MEKQVIWKTIPGYPAYEVSEYGEVRRGSYNLTPERRVGDGRKRFCLSQNGVRRWYQVAQLVAMAFIGPKPFPRAEVCHYDGFEHNNHFTNLRWDTRLGNVADDARHVAERAARMGIFGRKNADLAAAASAIIAANKNSWSRQSSPSLVIAR